MENNDIIPVLFKFKLCNIDNELSETGYSFCNLDDTLVVLCEMQMPNKFGSNAVNYSNVYWFSTIILTYATRRDYGLEWLLSEIREKASLEFVKTASINGHKVFNVNTGTIDWVSHYDLKFLQSSHYKL